TGRHLRLYTSSRGCMALFPTLEVNSKVAPTVPLKHADRLEMQGFHVPLLSKVTP
ncbi:hypothetical protein NDU88_006959, partial [Pleurodeles waltl]